MIDNSKTDLFEGLNSAQKAAVLCTEGPSLGSLTQYFSIFFDRRPSRVFFLSNIFSIFVTLSNPFSVQIWF